MYYVVETETYNDCSLYYPHKKRFIVKADNWKETDDIVMRHMEGQGNNWGYHILLQTEDILK